jgi:hypothetical protein
MYHQSSARPNNSEPESDRLKTLLDNLNNLRGKLKNFTVIDELGQPLGEISDLILDAGHQLNLVIAQPDSPERRSSILLNGRRIKKVSVQTQSVFVDITKADARFLPEYLPPDDSFAPPAESAADLPPTRPLVEPSVDDLATVSPPPVAPLPDFSLDVMEPPPVPATAATDETLEFPELENAPATETSGELFELERPNEARSLDEFSLFDSPAQSTESLELEPSPEFALIDTPTSPPIEAMDLEEELNLSLADSPTSPPIEELQSEALDDFRLPLDETVETNTVAELPELNFEIPTAPVADDTADLSLNFEADTPPDATDEWAEFDRIMAVPPASSDASLAADFALPEPEMVTASETELPELHLNQTSAETTNDSTADALAAAAFADLSLTADTTDPLILEPLPDNAVEAQWAEFDREVDEPSIELPSLESAVEARLASDLPELTLDDLSPTVETSPDLSFDLESQDNFDAIAETPLPDLSFDLESPNDFSLESETPADLSFDLESTDDFSLTSEAPSELNFDLEAANDFDSPMESASELNVDLAAQDDFSWSTSAVEPGETSPEADEGLSWEHEATSFEPDLNMAAVNLGEPDLSFNDPALNLDQEEADPSVDLSSETESLADVDLVGDADTIAFTEDGTDFDADADADADLETISSLADLDFTPEVTPTPADLADEEILAGGDINLGIPSSAAIEYTLDAQPNASSDFAWEEQTVGAIAEPAPLPDLELDSLAESLSQESTEPDLNLDLTDAVEAVDLPEPPAINLDDLGLSSTPIPLPTTEPSFLVDRPTDDPALTTASTANQAEFGLESIPAETFELAAAPAHNPLSSTESLQEVETPLTPDTIEAVVPLLEERLKVEYERRKVGDVVIRKQIETRMVQVPVRYEKLVIEQVGDQPKTLAEVDLNQDLNQTDLAGVTAGTLVSGEFKSARTASHVLDAIAKTLRQRCKNVRIEVELDDPKLQKAYQDWLNQCSQVQ